MAVIPYPDLKQCAGTSRDEVTRIETETAESGKIRGRSFHSEPVYLLTLSHELVSRADYEAYDAWWRGSGVGDGGFENEIEVFLKSDNETYRGLAERSPQVEAVAPNLFNITFSLVGRML